MVQNPQYWLTIIVFYINFHGVAFNENEFPNLKLFVIEVVTP